MQFIVKAYDGEGMLDKRMEVRPRHLEGIERIKEHVIKPNPEIYQRLFAKFNLTPDECIFADDRAENIEGGRRLGMNGIVFKDAKAGFEYCGIIHCWNGDERLAFQLTMLREQSQAIDGE